MSTLPKPWLTVVMPVHCGAQWLEASLGSLADQADAGIEVLAIDSSPDDASAAIIRRFADRLRVRLEAGSDILPWPAKTNRGVALAGADHVCWLHQDDLWLPGRAAALREWIAKAPDAALHIAPSLIVDRSGRSLGIWRCPFSGEAEIDRPLFLERLLVQNFISAPAPLFRKHAWLACGGMDESLWYTGDWDIWLKLAGEGAILHHPEARTAFRVHGSSLTVTGSRNASDFEQQMDVVLARHLPSLAPDRRRPIERASKASIRVNAALAAASAGKWAGLIPALLRVLALGPTGMHRFLRDSRIVDRLMPRVRARLAGSF